MATKGLNFGQTNLINTEKNKQITDIPNVKEQLPSTSLFASSLINSKPKLISSILTKKIQKTELEENGEDLKFQTKLVKDKKEGSRRKLRKLVSNKSSLKKITDELAEIDEQAWSKEKSSGSEKSRKNKPPIMHPQRLALIQSVYINSKENKVELSVLSPSKADSFSSSEEEDKVEEGSAYQPLKHQLRKHFNKKIGINSSDIKSENITLKSILKVSSSLKFTEQFEKSQGTGGEKKSKFFSKSRSVKFGRKILVYKYNPDASIGDKITKGSAKREQERKRSLKKIRESWFKDLQDKR